MPDRTVDLNTWIPGPDGVRYLVLGEEGGEDLLIVGHEIPDDRVVSVIRHAGFGALFDWSDPDELDRIETWARQLHRCPRHGVLSWRVTAALAATTGWVRWTVFRILWHFLARRAARDTRMLQQLSRLGTPAGTPPECACEFIGHYRTCKGCGFCDSDGTGRVPSWWDWTNPADAPHDVNAGRAGYIPVTVIDLKG